MGKTPCTIHEACKMGDTATVKGFLDSSGEWDVDDPDAKGITCLGYAVGANRPAVVKLLLDKKAYGRTEMVTYLAGVCKVDAANTSGQTALALALKNKMSEAADALKKKGAKA